MFPNDTIGLLENYTDYNGWPNSSDPVLICEQRTKAEDDVIAETEFWVEGVGTCATALLGLIANFISALILVK